MSTDLSDITLDLPPIPNSVSVISQCNIAPAYVLNAL